MIEGINYIPVGTDGKPVQKHAFGDLLVGKNYDTTVDPKAERVKELAAEMAEILKDSYQTSDKNPVTSILFDQAVGAIVTAQMLVEKVVTFKIPEDEVNG